MRHSSTLPDLLSPVSQILLVTLVACALYFRTARFGSWTTARRSLAILLVGVIVLQAAAVTGCASAVAVLTAVLAPPLAMLTLLATDMANQEAKTVPDAAPHQVVVSGRNGIGHAPPSEVVAAVTTRISGPAIHTRFVADRRLLVADSAEDVAALDNRTLTPAEAGALRAGRVLTFSDPTWQASVSGVVLGSAHVRRAEWSRCDRKVLISRGCRLIHRAHRLTDDTDQPWLPIGSVRAASTAATAGGSGGSP